MAKKLPISAKAEASAKAELKLIREKKITEKIPADVSRAKATAWLDLISPFTEWAGLKGDELRHKREILRLQQEETLFVIGEKIKNNIGSVTNPIPNKFLIPFLERASLEEPDDEIVSLWANLFISAAENFSSHHIHFQNIISQISKKQAHIFAKCVGTNEWSLLELTQDALMIEMKYPQDYIRDNLPPYDRKNGRSIHNIGNTISKLFERPGILFVFGSIFTEDEEYWSVDPEEDGYNEKDEIDYEILSSIGLIRINDIDNLAYDGLILSAKYYSITTLGVHFAKACKIVK